MTLKLSYPAQFPFPGFSTWVSAKSYPFSDFVVGNYNEFIVYFI